MVVKIGVDELHLKVAELEKKNKEIMWVLERQHEILRVLGEDFRKRNNLDIEGVMEVMYG